MRKLSIITINYNNKFGLQRTINSVIAQTYQDFEWIIIDGGSTDGSKELIKQYNKYITYWVSEPDKGIYSAMNKGIKVADGEYMLFLNSGDYLVDANVLDKVIPLLIEKDFYVGNELRGDRSININISTPEKILRRLIFGSLPHQSTFILRKAFTKYGLYREDKQFVSDWWLFYTALLLGNAMVAKLPFVISVFDCNGVSCQEKNHKRLINESDELLSEISPYFFELNSFYRSNYEIIEALKAKKWAFGFFRIYFYIYRKWLK